MKQAFLARSDVAFSRADDSILGRWWWTVDRWLLAAMVLLMGIGALLVMSASPPVAERIGVDNFHFVRRQFVFLSVGLVVAVAVSLMSAKWIRRLACIGLLGVLGLLVITPFAASEIKGAARWIDLGPIALQPSEFLKPTLSVATAWMFAAGRLDPRFPGYAINTFLLAASVLLLMIQPDFGQSMLVILIWATQIFLAGLPMVLVGGLMAAGAGLVVIAYLVLPHVKSRVDRFLDPASGDTYQVERSMDAFMNGGLFGVGPGEGSVKHVLPDAHSDFIFAVAGEEFGLIFALLIVGLYAFIVLRGLYRVTGERNLFVVLAVSGLLVQFGLQALINMASALQLMPPKGMTLPFISYGGSSTLALAIGMGFILALTRKGSGDAP